MIKTIYTLEESKARITKFLNNASCSEVFLTKSEYDMLDSTVDLVKALEEARQYIHSLKGREFTVKNSEYFHISVVLANAFSKIGAK